MLKHLFSWKKSLITSLLLLERKYKHNFVSWTLTRIQHYVYSLLGEKRSFINIFRAKSHFGDPSHHCTAGIDNITSAPLFLAASLRRRFISLPFPPGHPWEVKVPPRTKTKACSCLCLLLPHNCALSHMWCKLKCSGLGLPTCLNFPGQFQKQVFKHMLTVTYTTSVELLNVHQSPQFCRAPSSGRFCWSGPASRLLWREPICLCHGPNEEQCHKFMR